MPACFQLATAAELDGLTRSASARNPRADSFPPTNTSVRPAAAWSAAARSSAAGTCSKSSARPTTMLPLSLSKVSEPG